MSLFSEFVNDWDELTYVPTTLGKVFLALIIVALIAVALIFARKNAVKDSSDKNPTMKLTIKQLAFCAMCLALATVLSEIKIFDMPTGGSITLLSMFVIALPGILFGLVPGIVTAVFSSSSIRMYSIRCSLLSIISWPSERLVFQVFSMVRRVPLSRDILLLL